MSGLCIVTCGKKKIWDLDPSAGPTRACDAYIGPFVRKCITYAETFHHGKWCILSAKHGLLWPDEVVPGPYDVCFLRPGNDTVRDEELVSQIESKGLGGYGPIIVLGGQTYTMIIRRCFTGKPVVVPLSGCGGIGHMMHRLNEALNELKPLI